MRLFLATIFFFLCMNASAQDMMTADSIAYRSIDGIVKELLRLISSEEGKRKNPKAIENLFMPQARLSILNNDPSFPEQVETVSLTEFVELLADPYYEEDFKEIELHKVVDEYNGIAQVFQTYEAKDTDGEHGRGLTSYQLVYTNDRWWILSLLWTGDSNGVSVPEKYLGK